MQRLSLLILFRDGLHDLNDLETALTRYSEPLRQVAPDHLKFGTPTLDVELSSESHVLIESQEIAEFFPHKDSSEIERCNQRIELSWDMKNDPGLMTNLVLFVQPEVSRLVGKCWMFDPQAGVWF
ncbi:hypothetical protein FHT80_000035 [Rhizobium sp. BK226]|uniref:hypothetical protein n=1 Tax=Rhizobium TaxID=379 RepID=UPI001618AFB8|nr:MULTISPECIES: hypothetical protein [Rhizobium]MBB3297349.1 hypothetical protein [Rhizobium sp. BK112]MBB3368510.1 hypothetical protein [Rhizobium sp. BK077]MBB4110732.1 hypothetical protein [Rhizobium sp. BK226]MBB4177242.1 hypothetical protein [Rhizobium sp. BK109]UTS89562.1 hypothetical protein NE851_23500 [Rhizobium anhuiense bv. trifolii]